MVKVQHLIIYKLHFTRLLLKYLCCVIAIFTILSAISLLLIQQIPNMLLKIIGMINLQLLKVTKSFIIQPFTLGVQCEL